MESLKKPPQTEGALKKRRRSERMEERAKALRVRAEFIRNRIDIAKIETEDDLVREFSLAYERALLEKSLRQKYGHKVPSQRMLAIMRDIRITPQALMAACG